MSKKQAQVVEEKPKPTRDEQLITILEKLAARTVGVDIDIANFKADLLPEPSEQTDDEQTAE